MGATGAAKMSSFHNLSGDDLWAFLECVHLTWGDGQPWLLEQAEIIAGARIEFIGMAASVAGVTPDRLLQLIAVRDGDTVKAMIDAAVEADGINAKPNPRNP